MNHRVLTPVRQQDAAIRLLTGRRYSANNVNVVQRERVECCLCLHEEHFTHHLSFSQGSSLLPYILSLQTPWYLATAPPSPPVSLRWTGRELLLLLEFVSAVLAAHPSALPSSLCFNWWLSADGPIR